MKLIFCKLCNSTFNLDYFYKVCPCGKSAGRYLENGDEVEIVGTEAVVLGILNHSFIAALRNINSLSDPDRDFEAFVFNKNYHKIKYISKK